MRPPSALSASRSQAWLRSLSSPSKGPVPRSLRRFFAQNSQLRPVYLTNPRPQLPFLSGVSSHPRFPTSLQRQGVPWQISRLLTTERKQYLREQLWLGGKYVAVSWTVLLLVLSIAFGIHNEKLERQYPSPREWSWMSRLNYRTARWNEEVDKDGTKIVDWATTGNAYRELLKRLENPDKDGQGLLEQADGGILVLGVGKAGLDIEDKPEAWRRGCYETLIGLARAAEHLDGWVRDVTRNIAFPGEVVIGPSNPNPRPCPPGAASAPQEDDCEPAFEQPEVYYMKILTTKGFSTSQRLNAALSYADWLDFKGLHDSALEMHKWGIDIAASALLDPASVLDTATGVIRPTASPISPNILLAATSLGIHHAKTSNLSAALPIFLSVLRARRSLPPPTGIPSSLKDTQSDDTGLTSTIRNLLTPPPYPPPPPTGDDPAYRTPISICEEAGLMAYIGEIMFASSSPDEGLAWTRDAVQAAESQHQISSADEAAQQRCAECLEVGLENWQTMVAKLARDEMSRPSKPRSWAFWSSSESETGRDVWRRELEAVEQKMRQIKQGHENEGERHPKGASQSIPFLA